MYMLSDLTPKELTIVSLRLGFVDMKAYKMEEVAKFLGIEVGEVRVAIEKAMQLYMANINCYLRALLEYENKFDEIGTVFALKN